MKRISRRRLLASGLVLPSSAYLSSAGLPPAAVPPALAQDAAAAEATLNPDLTSGKELYLLCWDNYKATGMETWLADFEAEMGGRVVLDKVASNSLQDKQIVSLSGQTGEYDLMTVDEPYMPAYSPYLMDLTPLIERDGFPVDDWVPIMWDAGVYEGKVYGIPFDPNVQILYYRQDLLDAQEIEVPTTWTGIYDAAMAAQDRDNELWGMAIMTKRDPQTGINLWTFINAWGNELFDENYQAAFVNDQGYAAAEFFKQVADTIAPSGHAGYDYAGISDAFATGKAVFMYNWASNTLNITEGENSVVADKVGFAPAPGEERALSMRGVWTIGIPAAAPEPGGGLGVHQVVHDPGEPVQVHRGRLRQVAAALGTRQRALQGDEPGLRSGGRDHEDRQEAADLQGVRGDQHPAPDLRFPPDGRRDHPARDDRWPGRGAQRDHAGRGIPGVG